MKEIRFLSFVLMSTLLVNTAVAVPSVTVDLVQFDPVDSPGSLRVDLKYGDDPAGAGLVFIQLDVAGSSSNLTGGGTDFSRFTFSPGAELADWNTSSPFGPLTDFGSGPSDSVYAVDLDSFTFPQSALGAGTHTLGTLNVNLSGLAAGSLATIALVLPGASLGTEFGQEFPVGDFQSFALVGFDLGGSVVVDSIEITVPPQTTSGQIPEPFTTLLGAMGMMALGHRRNRIS